jgi:hypothetical protein
MNGILEVYIRQFECQSECKFSSASELFMSHLFLIFDFVLQVLQDQNLFDPQDIDTAVEALGSEVCTIYLSCML